MKEKFEELFREWKSAFKFNAFISDGIVDFDKYEKPHVLFVLRDMNCLTERNLCHDLKDHGSGHKTWSNVGRWIKALLDGDAEYPHDMSSPKRAEQLRRVAVMNLKKEGGTSRVNGEALTDSVENHSMYIYREIELCDPGIIICCGLPTKGALSNAELLYKNVFDNVSEWKEFNSGSLSRTWWYYRATINGKNVPVISFCHPQVTNLGGNRGHDKLFKPLYQDMLNIRNMFLER